MLVLCLSFSLWLLPGTMSLGQTEDLMSEVRAYRAEVQSVVRKNEELERRNEELEINNHRLEQRLAAVEDKETSSGGMDTLVGFSVILNQNHSPVPNQNIPYNGVTTNVGSAWSTTGYQFVAPVDGVYMFFAKCRAVSSSSVLAIFRDATPVVWFMCNNNVGTAVNGATSAVFDLNAGQTVSVRNPSGQANAGLDGTQAYNTFSGVKIN